MNTGYKRRLAVATVQARERLWSRYPHEDVGWVAWCDATMSGVTKRHKQNLAIEVLLGVAAVVLVPGLLHGYTLSGLALITVVPFIAGTAVLPFSHAAPKAPFTVISAVLIAAFVVSTVVYLFHPFAAASVIAAAYCVWIMFFLPPGFLVIAVSKSVRSGVLEWARWNRPPQPDTRLVR
jgi:CBS-domain-containing membrane protein